LKDRKVQQIGAPMEIYRRPANRFVAAFVGSPPMNFLTASGVAEGGKVTASLAGGTVIRTQVEAAGIDLTSPLVVGLRPEHIRVGDSGEGRLKARVEMVERLGERTLVYLKSHDGTALTAEASGDSPVQMGDEVGLQLSEASAHIFDKDDQGHHPTLVAQL
jgi:multiple sugar transport system ATP-binding protein